MKNYPTLIPLVKFDQYYPDPPLGTLRWYVHTNHKNFNEKCVVRRGRRVLIDYNKYEEWLRENN